MMFCINLIDYSAKQLRVIDMGQYPSSFSDIIPRLVPIELLSSSNLVLCIFKSTVMLGPNAFIRAVPIIHLHFHVTENIKI